MKVKIGDSVKNIPKRFHLGVYLMKESQLEAPLKKRLTPFERFLFAEAAWRKGLPDSLTKCYLNGKIPTYAAIQINRGQDKRYVVHYESPVVDVVAIVPKSVYKNCPKELRMKQYREW